jgi:hypothetical protein
MKFEDTQTMKTKTTYCLRIRRPGHIEHERTFESEAERGLFVELHPDAEYDVFNKYVVEEPFHWTDFEHIHQAVMHIVQLANENEDVANLYGTYLDEVFLSLLPSLSVKEASRKTLEAMEERFGTVD